MAGNNQTRGTRRHGKSIGRQHEYQYDGTYGYALRPKPSFFELHSAPVRKPTVDPNPVVPPIYVTDSEDISFPAMTYAPAVHPNSDPLPPPPAPTAVPLPPAAFLSMDSAMHTLPPLNIPTQPPIYTIPPPTIPLVTIARAPIPTTDHFPFQTPQPKISFSYPAPPSLNIPPTEPGTPTQAAPPPLPTNIPPKVENEQERRIRRMEETIGALQASSSRFDYGDSNSNLFPGMWLPPKIKIPNFKRYDGTSDSRHHLCHYQSKMMSYKDYEKFVVQTFQDSLAGSALDWFMTLKADDIPTWTDLSQKFLDQYRFCAESPYTPRSQHNGDEGKSGFRSLCGRMEGKSSEAYSPDH
ncbi:wiskott-Aldrich syndrome protein family member 1-like [Punica granatum]|uniref:Wiskott-Aldrich syndrome protein family member 1-like n=1 Tax=Punica granatum TaxID=22663 RepID=A0A6P8C2D6_PUNGR|nr:wiskott-Aldrich syndrome protein family member 1-like [Punica granatum]